MNDPYAEILGGEVKSFTGKAQFKGTKPFAMDALTQMSQEYYELTGKQLKVNDAFRTYAAQAEAKRKKPFLAAYPGRSFHEKGLAFDIDEAQANQLASIKDKQGRSLLEKYGFTRPMMSRAPGKKYEPWHIQMSDLQRQAGIRAAMVDPYAEIIESSAVQDPYTGIIEAKSPGTTTASGLPLKALEFMEKGKEEAAIADVAKMPPWKRRIIHGLAGGLHGMNIPWITSPIVRKIRNITGVSILGGEDTQKGLEKVMALTEEGAKRGGDEFGIVQKYGPELVGSIGPYAAAGGLVTKAATKLPYVGKMMQAAGELPGLFQRGTTLAQKGRGLITRGAAGGVTFPAMNLLTTGETPTSKDVALGAGAGMVLGPGAFRLLKEKAPPMTEFKPPKIVSMPSPIKTTGWGKGVNEVNLPSVWEKIKGGAKIEPEMENALIRDAKRIFAAETLGPKAKRAGEIWVEQAGLAYTTFARTRQHLNHYRTEFGKLSQDDAWKLSSMMERGQIDLLPKEWQPYAKARAEMFTGKGGTWDIITGELGKELGYIEHYAPHLWENPAKAAGVYARFGNRPFEGSKGFKRARIKSAGLTVEDMRAQGVEPRFKNPVDQDMAGYLEQLKFIHAHRFLNQSKKEGLLKFYPNSRKAPEDWVRLADPTRSSARLFEVWSGTPKTGFFKNGEYYAPREVADLIDNHFAPGLKNLWFTKYHNLTAAWNMWHVAWSAFHGTTTTVHDIAFGFGDLPRAFGQIASGNLKGGLKTIAAAEPLTRPVRTQRLGKKAIEAALEPGKHGPEMDFIVQMGIKGGMRPKISHPMEDAVAHSFGEFFKDLGHGDLSKVWRTGMRQLSKPIMDIYVPRAKWGTFVRRMQGEFEKIQLKYAGKRLSPAEQTQMYREMQTAAYQERQMTENIFGELAYDNLHMHQGLLRGLRAVIGYPGWNIGTFRFMAGMVRGPAQFLAGQQVDYQAKRSMEFGFGLLMSNAVFNSMLQYGMIREWPKDWKDVMIGARTGKILSNGTPERVGVASYMKDILGMAVHPFQTIENKFMFSYRMAGELLRNKDYFNTEIRTPRTPWMSQAGEVTKYVGEQALPFSVPRMAKAPSPGRAVGEFFGVTPRSRVYSNTEAQQMMDEFLQKKSPPKTKEEAAKWEKKRTLMDEFRKDRDMDKFRTSLKDALKKGDLTEQQVLNMYKDAQQPELISYFRKINDLKESLKIYQAGTEEEKNQLTHEMARKISAAKNENLQKNKEMIKQVIQDVKGRRKPWILEQIEEEETE